MEVLAKKGKGSLNADVEVYPMHIDLESGKFEVPSESITVHMFFPNADVLEDYYFSSPLVRENHPEYVKRLHCGAGQVDPMFFSDQVLERYLNRPEYYDVDDSLSGGRISTRTEAPENGYLDVRYGKRELVSGQHAITAIVKDLYRMSKGEQSYWFSYELDAPKFAVSDPNFNRFVARTYGGAFVDYDDPIENIYTLLEKLNKAVAPSILFAKTKNPHLRIPVENNEKKFCDSCSELFKLIGPDSIKSKDVKAILLERYSQEDSNLIHAESGRSLSPLQLFQLLEKQVSGNDNFYKVIKVIQENRIKADHRISTTQADDRNYVAIFNKLCENLVNRGDEFVMQLDKPKSELEN